MDYNSVVRGITQNIEKVIIGKAGTVELLVIALLSGGNVLIEDIPGVGKTTLANALVKSINCGFSRIQFTPDTLPSDVTGLSIYNMATGKFEYNKGAVMSNIILADEINRTSPKTQSSLLEAMEEKQVTVDGNTYALPKPFMVIATQNPIEHLGTYNLPEAQLDRFLMKISIGYPSLIDEYHLVELNMKIAPVKELDCVTDGETVLAMQEEVKNVKITKDLITYIVKIIRETRNNPKLTLGASPRATLAVVRASQATAFYKGRDYVIPDDIIKIAPYVIEHRLILSSESRINSITPKAIITEILEKIPVPV